MRHLTWLGFVILIAAVALASATEAEGRDLFEVIAQVEGEDPVRAGGSSVIDLLENVVRNRDEFADFEFEDNFAASLTYAGVRNAITLDFFEDPNTGEQAVTLELITGFSRTFTGSDRDDLEDQIVDFIKEDGAKEYAKFQREIEKRSVVAVLDGNPSSTTALLSRHTFQRFGIGQIGPIWFDRPATEWGDGGGRRFWFSLNPSYDRIDADRFSGQQVALDMSSGFWFSDHVGLAISSVWAYREVEGADTFQAGLDVGLPIRFLDGSQVGGAGFDLGWQLTPFGSFGGGGSIDMAAGGLIGGGGATNQLHFGFEHFDLVAGAQIAYYEGIRVRVDDYEFRPELSQWVFTGGVMGRYPIDQAERFVIEPGTYYTRYLKDAAVQSWVSPTLGIAFRTQRNHTFKLNYTADIGERSYRSHRLGLGMNIQF